MLGASNPGVVVAFAAGMLSFLSPCVLPLVPGYLSLMSGVGTADLAVATRADTGRLLRSTLLFVAGFTVVFVALGATASAVGSFLLDHQRTLNTVAGVVVIAMGLTMAGVVTPAFMQRERRVQVLPSKLGGLAPPVMGMAFAFGWTPCLGPVLASLLALAGAEATLGRGVALLFAYSLGLGVPFVAAGLGFGRLAGTLDWARRRARAVNLVSGLLLAGFGFLLLTNRLTDLSRELVELMDGTPFGWLIGL
ncbi:MAG: cytochrome c biogenesis CcdA family protein [Acidimicrobiales bacterium]